MAMIRATRTAAKVGTQKAMGMALPATESMMIPANRAIKGRISPNIPPRNSITADFLLSFIQFLLVIS